jgi:uncharacterized protein YbjT (DUF2867 family)
VEACEALYAACAERGQRRVVHISAAGVEPGRATAFNHTKLEAEDALKLFDLDWIILRPGLVLAPAAYGGTALLRGLAGFPGVIPIAHPEAFVQIVSVDDVALAVARAVLPTTPARLSIDLVGPELVTLGELLKSLRRWLGFPPARLLALPASMAAQLADMIGYLGWRSPMRTTSMVQLSDGVTGDHSHAFAALGVRPRSLPETLAGWPSGVQERWFARLYFLKPAALVGQIGFWLVSGVIGLTSGFSSAVEVLTSGGMATPLAKVIVAAGAVADIGVAAAACFRSGAPWALRGMMLLCALYLMGGSVLRPDLWLDPLGPFTKVIPVALLALMTLAVMDER